MWQKQLCKNNVIMARIIALYDSFNDFLADLPKISKKCSVMREVIQNENQFIQDFSRLAYREALSFAKSYPWLYDDFVSDAFVALRKVYYLFNKPLKVSTYATYVIRNQLKDTIRRHKQDNHYVAISQLDKKDGRQYIEQSSRSELDKAVEREEIVLACKKANLSSLETSVLREIWLTELHGSIRRVAKATNNPDYRVAAALNRAKRKVRKQLAAA